MLCLYLSIFDTYLTLDTFTKIHINVTILKLIFKNLTKRCIFRIPALFVKSFQHNFGLIMLF